MPHPQPSVTAPAWAGGGVSVCHGDALAVLRGMPSNSIDSVVTDPPYGMSKEPNIRDVLTCWLAGDTYDGGGGGFMGADWDSFVPGPAIWRETYRVLKPGGHALVFSSSRTYDLLATALRLAGFEIRDTIHWVYGQGWPKSMNVAKAIQKHLDRGGGSESRTEDDREPSTAWDGWGTALKPAHELIALVRKPLDGSVAANVLEHGVGGLNIDASRVRHPGNTPPHANPSRAGEASESRRYTTRGGTNFAGTPGPRGGDPRGRFPTNMLFTHSPGCHANSPGTTGGCVDGCPARILDGQSGTLTSGSNNRVRSGVNRSAAYGAESRPEGTELVAYGDSGGASRFFPVFDAPFRYAKKAGRTERPTVYVPDPGCRPGGDRGCGPDPHAPDTPPVEAASIEPRDCPDCGTPWVTYQHPTVKPVGGPDGSGLMGWLIRLVTPPGGVTLDLFAGTGTTGVAAARTGFRSILIERDPVHVVMIQSRLAGEQDRAAAESTMVDDTPTLF